MNYQQVSEKDKPWLKDNDVFHRTFYPTDWGKKNSYALFSPGIDRFLLIDTYDPWMLFETGQLLSSKVSNITYILDKDTPPMSNETCLEFSTIHKKDEKGHGGPTIASHRQSAAIMKIRPDNMIRSGWPIDFFKPERKQALEKLQEYARFTLRVVYAINISSSFKNPFPEKQYVENFFQNEYPEEFKLRYDTSSSNEGMPKLIKKILYEADSIEVALNEIHTAWRTYSINDISGCRQMFYYTLGIRQPEDLESLGGPGKLDRDRNDQTMWVV